MTAIYFWTLIVLAATGPGFFFLVRGKLSDWRSLAERAVRFEQRGNSVSVNGLTAMADDFWQRAQQCEASIPRPLRGWLLRGAWRLAVERWWRQDKGCFCSGPNAQQGHDSTCPGTPDGEVLP